MIFFSCSIEFYFTHGHQKCYFHSSRGYAVYENGILTKILSLVFNSIHNTTKSNTLYIFELTVAFAFMLNSPEVKTHGIRTTRLHVSCA